MTANAALIAFLEGKLQHLLDIPPEEIGSVGTKTHARWQAAVRRARLSIARARGTHTSSEWEAIVAETGGICVRCGYQHDLEHERPCKSYILPIAAGGSNAIDNLMPLCRRCAVSKNQEGINWLAEWRRANPS